jgi:8-oxo-dGTP pyrophosphatase MutT (NUDIX family)
LFTIKKPTVCIYFEAPPIKALAEQFALNPQINIESADSDPWLQKLLSYFMQQRGKPAAPITHPDIRINESFNDLITGANYRQAAVLIPVVRPSSGQGSSILLTVRTDNLSSHAGQVSFPGGTVDEDDSDPVHTALRESAEEIGLRPESVQIVGQLGQILLPSGFCVTPIVGLIEPGVLFIPSPREVAHIFQAPSSLLLNPLLYQRKMMTWQNIERHVLELHFEQYRIWGATATILHHLGSELVGIDVETQLNSSLR